MILYRKSSRERNCQLTKIYMNLIVLWTPPVSDPSLIIPWWYNELKVEDLLIGNQSRLRFSSRLAILYNERCTCMRIKLKWEVKYNHAVDCNQRETGQRFILFYLNSCLTFYKVRWRPEPNNCDILPDGRPRLTCPTHCDVMSWRRFSHYWPFVRESTADPQCTSNV